MVSDAEAPSNLVDPEHYFDDHAESHAAALKAGIDSFTDHGEDTAVTVGRITEALERGLLTMDDVDAGGSRQLLASASGWASSTPRATPTPASAGRSSTPPPTRSSPCARPRESVVLLKNEGLLPLPADRRVAVVGPLACTLFEDWYSGSHPYRITVADGLGVQGVEGVDRIVLRTADGRALTAAGPHGLLTVAEAQDSDPSAQFDLFDWDLGVLTLRSSATGRYASLRDADRRVAADRDQPGEWDVHETFRLEPDGDGGELLRSVLTGRYAQVHAATGVVAMSGESPAMAAVLTRTVVRDGVAEAVAAAAAADTAVVVLGNDPHINGRETQDRAGLNLPPNQDRLLRAVLAAQPDTVLVVMSSYPYALDWAAGHVPAILWTSHAGQETGRALARVLRGDADASGRLPQTWYQGEDELPERLDYDIIKAGWTYQYHRTPALYPFGHGLSYADFSYSRLALDADRLPQDGTVTARVSLGNRGERAGMETVQLYVRALDARYEAPLLRLADFRKVRLAAGEWTELEFRLPVEQALAHWDVATGAFTVDPGRYELLVARSAADPVLTARFTVDGPAPAPRRAVGRPLRAVDFDDYRDAVIVDAGRTDGDAVTPAANQAARLVFRNVDLTGAATLTAEVSRTAPGPAGLDVYADGLLLAALPVDSTGDRYTWTTVSAALGHQHGTVGELTVVLTGEQRLAALTFAP